MREEKITLNSIRNAALAGKRVLLRTSLNVPISDGAVADTYRLRRGLNTLQFLLQQKAKVIVVGYIGRDGADMRPVAVALQTLLPDFPIRFEDVLPDALAELSIEEGACVVVQNTRRHAGEELNDAALAQQMARGADLFVNDAFAEAHRAYASNVGVAALLPAYAGLLMEEEVARLSEALNPAPGSLAVIGGAKFETKEPLLKKLLAAYETVMVGGAIANDILSARGVEVKDSHRSNALPPSVLVDEPRLLVPVDFVWRDAAIVDIGPETADVWSDMVSRAPFVLWNGPMGIYEQGLTAGTDALAEGVANGGCRAVIGGGDTAAALAEYSFDDARVFVSTGGGAMLEFLTNGTLPALEALQG